MYPTLTLYSSPDRNNKLPIVSLPRRPCKITLIFHHLLRTKGGMLSTTVLNQEYISPFLLNRIDWYTSAAMSFEPTFYYSNNTARENFTSPVFFNAISLHGSEKVLTHTHTHRPDLLISFFIRAREERRTSNTHWDSERILRAVFRILSGSEIRENKERISRQKPYDFQAAICRVSTSMNPHSGVSPHWHRLGYGYHFLSITPCHDDK